MNGVRRFLGGGGPSTHPPPPPPPQSQPPPAPVTPPPPPPPASSKPSWLPQHLHGWQVRTGSTPGLVIRKERSKPSQVMSPTNWGGASVQSPRSVSTPASARSPTGSITSYSIASPSRRPVQDVAATILGSPTPSSTRVPPPSLSEPTQSESSVGWKRTSGLINLRDELLVSLLTSEAVVESRECEILSAEEVEELKKEYHVLKIRTTAMQRKLGLETKIRDAALSLSRVNAAHRKVSKQTEAQLETAERKVATAQKELWRVSERTSEVYRKLLEHRAGVLGYSVHKMEKKFLPSSNGVSEADASRALTPNRNSTFSLVTSAPSTPSKFDGAHLFAGHADAQIPKAPLPASDVTTLEANLRAATKSLNAANKKNAELARELSHLRLEKEEMETTMCMELQSAEETVAALENELPRFEEIQARCDELTRERVRWEQDRQKLAAREQEVEMLERRLEVLEEKTGEAAVMEKMLATVQEKADADVQKKGEELAALQVEYEGARANWQAEKAVMDDELEQLKRGNEAQVELVGAFETLQTLMRHHNVDHTSRDASLQGLLASVGAHLENLSAILKEHCDSRDQLEAHFQAELEASRRETNEAKREVLALDARVKELTSPSVYTGPPIEFRGEVADVVALLQPVWAVLPAPELRSVKLHTPRHLRGASTASSSGGGHSKPGLPSLSDMDIRSLKALYDPKSSQTAVGGPFSLEAFVARVQALVIDDRTLIERLIRSAQAHDLLKKNAERARKLVEDSNVALETYQKQVATLDDQNFALQNKQAALMNEIQELQTALDRATSEKRDLEMHAADQAETCRQLTEANNRLSAKTLSLAQEVASAPEMVRKQLEVQLDECRKALREAQEEIEAMRTSEQTQRIALMDELNTMQTENANMRAQLRALKK
ncbi:Up-regulated during septation-domain-containing protein [Boletus edulis BED1]|uniref:Up-regulated during septation-domain-containing protein n=1 Tax=Boletus edulis BED1 TaxID=1328754 RepID=A0AAD4BQ25_BOLED|nr:Up-regulated during septation-domain-containing protein [Boletus edulis BED1]